MPPEPEEGRLDETVPFKVLSPGTMISHYRITEKIGEGGMGVVYKAEDTKLKRTVALKFLPPRMLCDAEARERFEHEAQSASALNHPNIATIYEIDEVEATCFIAMEYLEGGSLKGYLRKKDLSVKEILDLAIQIGEGLNAAHERDVIHRDIKPDNIMLTRKGLAKILDFGLAKLKGATKVTKTGTTLGTLQYMSPEQAGGEEVDSRSDIFSLGVILYEMITGRLPFRGDNEAAIINSILNDTPEPLARYKADLPEGLPRIVDRALTKDPGERYQHADDMVAELRHEKRLLETGASTVIQTRPIRPASRRRLLPILIPALIAAVVILLIFIFEPFRIEMGPGEQAIAQENSLAIMYFENMADPEDADRAAQMLTSLLITDLSESEYVRVVSRQRLYDILKLLGKEDLKVIDKTVASDVAKEAGVKWILAGGILQIAPSIVLASDISDARTGEILATQRVTGEVGEDLFSVVDRLTVEIKADLSLPEQATREPDRPVADVTTHSPEAYRHYLEGRDYIYKYYDAEARERLRKAVELDSTFAMAYYWLAWLTGGSEREEMIARAVEYSDNASWKERQYIEARAASLADDPEDAIARLESILGRYPDEKEAWEVLGWIHYDLEQYEQAAFYYEKVIEIDPLYKDAYNSLAYTYDEMGDFEKSIWAINKYISLAPDEPNPYDSRGDLYRYHGDLDQAIESYEKALAIKPDFYGTLADLGDMCLFRKEYARAESCYQALASCSEAGWRTAGRTYLAFVPLYQGKFEAALQVLDNGVAADRMEQKQQFQYGLKHYLKAAIYGARDSFDLALKEYEVCLETARKLDYDAPVYVREYKVWLLARKGDFEKAEEVARDLKRDIEANDESRMDSYWYAAGFIDFAKGDYDASVVAFEKSAKGATIFYRRYMLGIACLESGRLGEAVATLEEALARYDGTRAIVPHFAVNAYYLLGLAYEKSGWNNKAIENYEEFLDIWKDADPGIQEIEDARQRLARLKSGA